MTKLTARNKRRAELIAARDAYLEDQDINKGWSGPEWDTTAAGRELAALEALRFAVTYEIVTPESAANCEIESRGFIEHGASLRDAVWALQATRTSAVAGMDSIELDASPCDRPRAVCICNAAEFETGAHESRTLHIPDSVTRSSARRIARVLGVSPLALRTLSSLYAYGFDGSVIRIGDRVELAPGSDLWTAGLKYGTVESMSRTRLDAVHVRLDETAGTRLFCGPGEYFRRIP